MFLMMLFFSFNLLSCRIQQVITIYEDSISLKSMPKKTEYFIGEKINYEGISVIGVLENGENVEISDYDIFPNEDYVLSDLGKQDVVIKYKTRELRFSINVFPVENIALYVKQIPKSAYYSGEELDLSNLELEVLKSNGTKEIVKDYISIPENGTVLENSEDGKRTITVKYGNISTSFDVSSYNQKLWIG